MKAMVLEKTGHSLQLQTLERPEPTDQEVQVRVEACGVCRTDLHILDGELNHPSLPLIPGHQIVGRIQKIGRDVNGLEPGDRVGIPWVGRTCDDCFYCRQGMENLCKNAEFTGYTRDGGFAEYTVAHADYCFPLRDDYPPEQAAPLLCGGLIGYRSLRMTGEAERLGFYGFGSAAHILIQVTNDQNREVYAFTRPGDEESQQFARSKGAVWAGGSDTLPPKLLDAAIIFAPVGPLVPQALKAIRPGGKVICAGIHMSDIPEFPYKLLWEERSLHSVANLTRRDGKEFLELAPQIPIQTHITTYSLNQANKALQDLREGRFDGSEVIQMDKTS